MILRKANTTIFTLALVIAVCPAGLYAHEAEKTNATEEVQLDFNALGFIEKTGDFLPLDTMLVDESGRQVAFSDAIEGPTILSIIYYKCPDQCRLLLVNIARLLGSFSEKPGSEPNLVTLSIDEHDTPENAREAKRMAFASIEKPYPNEKWHFLTGTEKSIRAITDAAGFGFIRRGTDFDHPLGLIILSPKGQVSRYIIGTDFLPADITISLMEANTGTIQPTIARLIRLCFSYDPSSRKLVFNTLQVSAVVILLLTGSFIIYLIFSAKSRRQKGAA